jgi:cell division protein FtsI/penicillin-binding protein 2
MRSQKDTTQDNRTTLLVAVIFLFSLAIIARLFNVQVLDGDVYAARALQQHGVAEDITPNRGRIFVRTQAEKSDLYPLAANKEFALVYAVPKDVLNPSQAAETLAPVLLPFVYEEPDKKKLLAAIEKNIRERLFQEAKAAHPPAAGVEVAIDEEQVQVELAKEQLVLDEKLQKEEAEALTAYQSELEEKFSKAGDPYEPLVKKVDKDVLKMIIDLNIAGIAYSLSSYRYYPESNISGNVLGYVIDNPDNEITQGSYGIEGYFNAQLAGTMGAIKAERDARGELIIVADREVHPAVDGNDIILTIDKTIQDVACRKLNESALRHGADTGTVIIINPQTGAIIAMCSYPDFDPNDYGKTKELNYFNNIGIFQAYEPGSIFKPLTMSMGLDLGLVEPDSVFFDPGSVVIATETIKNAEDRAYGEVTMTGILENSINTGAVYVARKVGINNFLKYMNAYGFGQQTGITLMTESAGNISSLYDKMHGADLNLAVSSFGQSITATPLQMVSAFAAIANGGILMKPYIVSEIITPSGEHFKSEPQVIGRVISPRAAALTAGMMVSVVENGHAKRAQVPGYYVAAKTGTAQIASKTARGYGGRTNHSLIGFAPADNPVFVMITYLEDPKDAKYAESTATPLFGEIADFVLNYKQVEKER